jgi:ABC-type dipeptide/oligopeptide/nickel transport system permease subunit
MALVLSFKVRDYWQSGHHEKARQTSTYVQILNIISIVIGSLVYLAAIIIGIIVGVVLATTEHYRNDDSSRYN